MSAPRTVLRLLPHFGRILGQSESLRSPRLALGLASRPAAITLQFRFLRCYSEQSTGPRRACTSCQTALPVTTTPCTSCETLLPFPDGISHHSILGLSKPVTGDTPTTFDIPAELFTLPSHGYTIDVRDARQRMLQRQKELHPDKFGSGGEVIVQLARDLSGRVNEAYSILADPLKRADYILSIHSQATEEGDSLSDPELLAEIMEAREDLEHAQSKEELEPIKEENEQRIQSTIISLTEAFSQTPPDLASAKDLAVQLRYWRGLDDAIRDWEPGKSQVMIH